MNAHTFQPNKNMGNDGIGSEFTNEERAIRGEKAVRVHPDSTNVKSNHTSPEDIMADIFHFCDKVGYSVEMVIQRAKMHWEQER